MVSISFLHSFAKSLDYVLSLGKHEAIYLHSSCQKITATLSSQHRTGHLKSVTTWGGASGVRRIRWGGNRKRRTCCASWGLWWFEWSQWLFRVQLKSSLGLNAHARLGDFTFQWGLRGRKTRLWRTLKYEGLLSWKLDKWIYLPKRD